MTCSGQCKHIRELWIYFGVFGFSLVANGLGYKQLRWLAINFTRKTQLNIHKDRKK